MQANDLPSPSNRLLVRIPTAPSTSSRSLTTTSTSSTKVKYAPQRSVQELVYENMNKSHRSLPSRGHDIPLPLPSDYSPCSVRSNITMPHFSPIRPLPHTSHLHSRPSSPMEVTNGRMTPSSPKNKLKYPLNSIAYPKPSRIATSIYNATLPSDAECILEDSRFESIGSFTRKELYQSISNADRHELAQRRRRKKIIPPTYTINAAPLILEYEKQSKGNRRPVYKLMVSM